MPKVLVHLHITIHNIMYLYLAALLLSHHSQIARPSHQPRASPLSALYPLDRSTAPLDLPSNRDPNHRARSRGLYAPPVSHSRFASRPGWCLFAICLVLHIYSVDFSRTHLYCYCSCALLVLTSTRCMLCSSLSISPCELPISRLGFMLVRQVSFNHLSLPIFHSLIHYTV